MSSLDWINDILNSSTLCLKILYGLSIKDLKTNT